MSETSYGKLFLGCTLANFAVKSFLTRSNAFFIKPSPIMARPGGTI